MAIKKEIVIEIASDGSLTLTTHGLKGTECDDEMKPIESALGKVKERHRTNEFYEKPTVSAKIGSKTK